MHCCQSIRAEKEVIPNSSSHWGVRGNTSSRFTPPLNFRWHDPYAESPSVLHMKQPISPVLGGKWKKKQELVQRARNLSQWQKVTSRDSLFYFAPFMKGCENLKKCINKNIGFSIKKFINSLTNSSAHGIFWGVTNPNSIKVWFDLGFFLFVGTCKHENQIWVRQ